MLISLQFLAEFVIEGVERLEQIANPTRPPFSLDKILRYQKSTLANNASIDHVREACDGLSEFREPFRTGRGDLQDWSPEVLSAIDGCFVEYFMQDGSPKSFLFSNLNGAAHSDEVAAAYRSYVDAVDKILLDNADLVPKFAREYFAYDAIWQLQGYSFPVPLVTASVVDCLHKIASKVRMGFIEVSVPTGPIRPKSHFRPTFSLTPDSSSYLRPSVGSPHSYRGRPGSRADSPSCEINSTVWSTPYPESPVSIPTYPKSVTA